MLWLLVSCFTQSSSGTDCSQTVIQLTELLTEAIFFFLDEPSFAQTLEAPKGISTDSVIITGYLLRCTLVNI